MSEEFMFDPMTGEKIVKKEEKEPEEEFSFDPMTGEKVVKKEEKEPEEEFSFDPMTGEKVVKKEEKEPEEEFSFDPMTGEKIVKKEEKEPEEEFSFDPMTGEKIKKEIAESSSTGKKESVGKNISKKFVGIAAGIAALLIIIIIGISSGLFLGSADKVLLATAKTFSKTSGFMELDEVYSALKGKKYSVAGSYSYDDAKAEITYNKYGKEKGMKLDVQEGSERIEAIALLTNKDLQISVPDVVDEILYYNYAESKNGYLVDELEEENIEFIDNFLAYLYENGAEEDAQDMIKDGLKVFRGLKFTKTSANTFEVNGKDRKCKGYKTTIGPDEMEQFADVLSTYYKNRMDALTKGLGGSDASDEIEEGFEDFYDDLLDEIDDMEDVDTIFYLYGGKLAAISLEIDGDVLEFQINNTKNPLEKMTIVYDDGDDDVEIEWEGEISRGKEEYSLRVEGTRILSVEYDKKSGDVEAEIMDYFTVDGRIEKKSGVVTYAADGKIDGEDVSFELSVSKKTEKIKMEGEKFDIGNASENDFEDLMDNFDYIFYEISRLLF